LLLTFGAHAIKRARGMGDDGGLWWGFVDSRGNINF
jgi:hypothetical protein